MIANPLDTIRRMQATLIVWQDFKQRTGHWPNNSIALAGFLNALMLVGAGYLVWFSVNHAWSKSRLLLLLAGPIIVWVFGGSWLRDKLWLTELRDSLKPGVWEIVKNMDGSYDILHAGKLLRPSIPAQYLYDALKSYGFRVDEYEQIDQQLDHSRKATIVW
jgi:hypothetical protein